MALIRFDNPEYLVLMISIPLMLITHYYFLKYTKRKAIKFANFQALKRVSGKKILTKNIIILLLRIFVIFFLILGISGPVVWYSGTTDINDFVIALDTSASMTTEDVKPNRFIFAKKIASQFIDSLSSSTKFSIVSFSGTTFVDNLLTTDKELSKRILNDIDISIAGGTDIGSALITSSNVLLNGRKSKKIVVISDGSNTAGSFVDDDIQAGIDYVNKNMIKVYTIGIGSQSGTTIYAGERVNIPVGYNAEVLKKIAESTGGSFYEIKSEIESENFFNEITEVVQSANLSLDLRLGFVTLSLLLLFIEWGLINTRFRAIP